jgi:hypothetical protein
VKAAKLVSVVFVITTLITGCATGYGALAGGGAVATLALVGAASSGADGPAPLTAAGGGFLIGLLAGAIGGAVASAVTRGQERRTQEQHDAEQQREHDTASLEERLRRLEGERRVPEVSPPTARRGRAAPQTDDQPAAPDTNATNGPVRLDLTPRAREFGSD